MGRAKYRAHGTQICIGCKCATKATLDNRAFSNYSTHKITKWDPRDVTVRRSEDKMQIGK